MGLFGKSKPADPKALVDEWTKKVRKEGYGLDRQIRQIQRQEQVAIKINLVAMAMLLLHSHLHWLLLS